MIPPIVRRCPGCGHLGRTRRFATVVVDGDRLVECPDCGCRFEPIENPWLQ